jgi:hypothetical protein
VCSDATPSQPHVADDDESERVVAFLNRFARSSRRPLLPMCGCQSSGSDAAPVITTLIAPSLSPSLCRAGAVHDCAIKLHADATAHADDERFALCDCDGKWSHAVLQFLELAGIQVIRTPFRAPNCNRTRVPIARTSRGGSARVLTCMRGAGEWYRGRSLGVVSP